MHAVKPALGHQPPAREDLDELTLARAKRGDRSAFGALVRYYQRPVFALLSRMLLATDRRDLVEDLAQETFVRARPSSGIAPISSCGPTSSITPVGGCSSSSSGISSTG